MFILLGLRTEYLPVELGLRWLRSLGLVNVVFEAPYWREGLVEDVIGLVRSEDLRLACLRARARGRPLPITVPFVPLFSII